MNLLLYCLKVVVCSGIFFGYYRLFLRNRRFHHYNRFYLLATLLLSLVLPLFNIPLFRQPEAPVQNFVYDAMAVINLNETPVISPAADLATNSLFTLSNGLLLVYAAGAIFLLTILIRSLLYIRRLSRRYAYERVHQLKFYNTPEPGTPFSFFNAVFWNHQLDIQSKAGQQVFRHELFHVRQHHSADIMLSELITIAGWFNPFFYLIKRELKAIHEFLADQYAVSGKDRYAYAELLLQQVLQTARLSINNPFFQHHLKRRIAMITQFNQTRYGYRSRVLALPLFLTVFVVVALKAQQQPPVDNMKSIVQDNITIKTDPGTHTLSTTKKVTASAIVTKSPVTTPVTIRSSGDKPLQPVNELSSAPPVITDSILKSLQRYYTRRIRYPAAALNSNTTGSIYFSVEVNQTGNLSDLKVYHEAPATNGQKIYELVTVGAATVKPEPALPAATTSQLLEEEVKRATAVTPNPGIVATTPERYYFRLIYKLDPIVTVDSIKTKVDEEARYPGGVKAWGEYLNKSLYTRTSATTGTVVIRFVVFADGHIGTVQAISGPDALRGGAIKLVQASGKWIPAVDGGKQVTSFKILPIIFLSAGKEAVTTGGKP